MAVMDALGLASRPVECHDKYVVHYDFGEADAGDAVEEVRCICRDLQGVGLETEVRAGHGKTLLIAVRVPKEILDAEVFKSRVKDWLWAITTTEPSKDDFPPGDVFEAESILSVYHLVNWQKDIGGAGITPGHGRWLNVKAIFPIHNHAANTALLKHLSQRVILYDDDLDQIRNLFGTKVAFYFAFMQTYFLFLFFPALTGLLAFQFLPKCSLVFAVVNLFGCCVFLEYWKLKQDDLSLRWNVKGVGSLKVNRPNYQYETTVVDAAGRVRHCYPKWKALSRQTLQLPFFMLALVLLGAMITAGFAVEVLVSEKYDGPYKSLLEYLPTIIFAVSLPYLQSYLEEAAEWLADFENHRTHDNFDMSLTSKRFGLSFIANYLPIFLTAFVYIPLGEIIVPQSEYWIRRFLGSSATQYFTPGIFNHNRDRLRDEVIALTVVGQVSDMFDESIKPFLLDRFRAWYRGRTQRASLSSAGVGAGADDGDDPAERAFVEDLRRQSALDQEYNAQDDISEMAIQFGYLALFAPVWPLVALGFLVNDWIELRSDFVKLCLQQRRPPPVRADGIGPTWIAALDGLAWMGSITGAAVVHMYGDDNDWSWPSLLVAVLVGEHVFLMLRVVVRAVLRHVVGSRQERAQKDARYAFRKRYLDGLDLRGRVAVAGLREDGGGEFGLKRRETRLVDPDAFWAKQAREGASERAGAALIEAASRSKGVVRKEE